VKFRIQLVSFNIILTKKEIIYFHYHDNTYLNTFRHYHYDNDEILNKNNKYQSIIFDIKYAIVSRIQRINS